MGAARAVMVWATIIPARPRGRAILRRAETLTPYAAETIAEDVRHAGPGARLELTVAADASDIALAGARSCFARLGVRVQIGRRRPGSWARDPDAA